MHVDLIPIVRALCASLILAIVACGPSSNNPDANADMAVSDGPSGDAPPFGTVCMTSSECPNSGYCVEGYGTKVCTYECSAGCPESWDCRGLQVDGAYVSVCVPPEFELCTQCTADTQCGEGICVTLGGEGFCLPRCPFEGDCPAGYTCGPDPTGANPGNYCVPMTQECTCTDSGQQGQVRTCTNTNSLGTCRGLETCNPGSGGWTGCSAPAAVPEMCDGVDNDCNGLVDDGVASGSSCTNTVAGVGSCPGVTLCAGAGGVLCQGPMPEVETCNYSDDNCSGTIDETFPGVGNTCTQGQGACLRTGIVRCTTAGTGTECSAVAGTPGTELCNNADDNCNGSTDETFPTKGNVCNVGMGACARTGNLLCTTNGLGVACSVTAGTPGTETCNNLDDNCNGAIDENFKNGMGQYVNNTACGACGVDCTVLFAVPNAAGVCNAGATPTCGISCNANAFDADGVVANGCELLLDTGAIYVSIDDPSAADDATCGLGPVGTGAGNHPCRTIAFAQTRAQALARNRVLIANGLYAEAVTIANGRSLLGGYRFDNWQRDVNASGTLIAGVSVAGAHDRTVVANNITAATLFEGFVVYGTVNTKVGGNSYAIYISGNSAGLTLRSNLVFAGRGGPGTNGVPGADGVDGDPALGRITDVNTHDAAYDAKQTTGPGICDPANNRQYINPGSTTCGAVQISGGSGGGNLCPATPGGSGRAGFTGANGGGPGGGGGGAGGLRGEDFNETSGDCFFPGGQPFTGADGLQGGNGLHGSAGAACSMISGSVVGGNWIGAAAGAGVRGGDGGGGGGGGAGGGAKCNGCPSGTDTFGGHGGGGGGGACGATGGTAGTSGGGSFGIFVTGTGVPTIFSNTIFRGQGGLGGNGGPGGAGGRGGGGGLGGTQGVPAVLCADNAGRGGNGGDSGHGAGGGGGCGGSSFGVFTSGLGSPSYCMPSQMNAFIGGTGGTGGTGGSSIVNLGQNGTPGAVATCTFQ